MLRTMLDGRTGHMFDPLMKSNDLRIHPIDIKIGQRPKYLSS